jgi:putative ABC transport system substrate-binding protein
MDRRTAAFALAVGPLAAAVALRDARAQPSDKVYRLGYLSHPTRESVAYGVDAFVRRLRELGWVEGRNLTIEYRWAEGDVDRLPALAADLVSRNVDVIVAPAGAAALAARNATRTIPIVMIFPQDPVEMGLVASLARPGGNVTGTTFSTGGEIIGKQLQILKEAVPRLARVALLRNPADPGWASQSRETDAAARAMNLQIRAVDARGEAQLDDAFSAVARERAEALLVAGSSTFLAARVKVAELARKGRLPTMCSYRENVEAGALMAYAVNMREFVGHAAEYVDRILRGAKPGDLPVEQPTKFELVINLKTAKAIGLAVPQSLTFRADELIQ